MRSINRTGDKNGKLTVTRPAPSREKHTYWYCSCECGKADVQVASSHLKKTLSCGCGKEDYLVRGKWEEIAFRTYGHFMPWAFIPKGRRADKSIGRNGYWLGRCTNCHAWMRATSTQLRTGRVMGCTLCDHKVREKQVKDEFLWLSEAVRRTYTRNSYYSMRRRCNDPSDARYGGRGIRVCKRWSLPNGEGYRNFVADMGLRRHRGLSLERIDPHGDYSPSNCVWADSHVQSRNKSTSSKLTIQGQEINQIDLAVALGTSHKALSRRIERFRKNGLSGEQIDEFLSAELHTVQLNPSVHAGFR